MSTFGERLREERKRLGFNQTAFAELAGVTKASQINYEGNKRSPDANYLAAISEVGVNIEYVIRGIRPQVLEENSKEINKSLEDLTTQFRLKEERFRLGLNQSQLGNAGGVTKEAQSNYERGIRKPDSDYWKGVAKIGVDVQYVITGVRSKNLSEVTKAVQLVEDSDELLGTLELLKKNAEKAMEIAKKRTEESKES